MKFRTDYAVYIYLIMACVSFGHAIKTFNELNIDGDVLTASFMSCVFWPLYWSFVFFN